MHGSMSDGVRIIAKFTQMPYRCLFSCIMLTCLPPYLCLSSPLPVLFPPPPPHHSSSPLSSLPSLPLSGHPGQAHVCPCVSLPLPSTSLRHRLVHRRHSERAEGTQAAIIRVRGLTFDHSVTQSLRHSVTQSLVYSVSRSLSHGYSVPRSAGAPQPNDEQNSSCQLLKGVTDAPSKKCSGAGR